MNKWLLLCKLKAGDIVHVREQCAVPMGDGAYKISNEQYFLADATTEEREEKVCLLSIYWACSEGAFRRVYYKDIERDDMMVRSPPHELLPTGTEGTYSQIKNALGPGNFIEHASYRIMTDGAFIHKSIESSSTVYYFRLPDIIDSELPYAILRKV